MAERAGYDQLENKYISSYTASREGILPSYQAVTQYQQTGFDQSSVLYQSTTHMTQPVGTVIIQTRPPDLLLPSIFACFCCFWPSGLFAVFYAIKANTLAGEGKYEEARRMSDIAGILVIISVVLGISCITVAAVITT
ncbi:trafficking regulator of GLUT4 1-like [Mercenaria mercenaria]|uniref:trafficking regulator of GLUT4 1-like n=1 Tax=Mercenaria mercenaria TaxID=6596 RepID=UPI00234F453E|nr:trafficking regulator of GLUT4 1-like [Mercenaria mercenaria]